MSYSIKQVLIERDGMSPEEANELIQEARERVEEGEDPEEILYEDFGLEPDYIFDLLV
jgi:TPP-dependent pyruvate/acetoin dehydrogenase alpha subunit